MEAVAVQDDGRFAYEGAAWWGSTAAAVLLDFLCGEITEGRAAEALELDRLDVRILANSVREMAWSPDVRALVDARRQAHIQRAGELVSAAARAGNEGRYEDANRAFRSLTSAREMAEDLATLLREQSRFDTPRTAVVVEAPPPVSVPDSDGDGPSGPLVSVVTDDGRIVSGRRQAGTPPPEENEPDQRRCSSCGEPMVWIRLKSGKANPCDPARLMVRTGAGVLEAGRVSHFATCPHADRHRRGAR